MNSFIRDGYLSSDIEGFVNLDDSHLSMCYTHLLIRNKEEDDTIIIENTIPCPTKEVAEFLLNLWLSGASIALPTTRL